MSTSLWDELVSEQSKVETDKIRIDQVFHCSSDPRSYDKNEPVISSIFEPTCNKVGGTSIETVNEKTLCTSTKSEDGTLCTIEANPFPGLFGTTPGQHCISNQQQKIIRWIDQFFIDIGWTTVDDV
jgi:hypothetical protein